MAATKKSHSNKKPQLAAVSNSAPEPSLDEMKRFYRDMLLIRRFEEKAGQLYGLGLIGGFCHLYIGQEAVITGIQSVQEPVDSVRYGSSRSRAYAGCGMDLLGVMAELTGRKGGYSHGSGGSMHMFSREKNFFGGHGIVGASTSIGTGLGFSHKYKEDGGVAVAYMGDGASNQGQVYECFNMASLWKLPILYIIENNKYGMGTSVQRHAAGDLYRRGEPYGIPGERVNGMDVFAVRNAARQALDYIRAGNGPYLLEMETYRYRGHSMSDPAKCTHEGRSRKLQRRATLYDPIDHLKVLMEEAGITEDDLKVVDKEIKEIVNEAAQFAQDSPQPDESELWTDVLKEVQGK